MGGSNEGPKTATAAILGSFTESTDTVAASLERIEDAVGTGVTPKSKDANMNIASVDTTYRALTDGTDAFAVLNPTVDGTLKGVIFLTNMGSGDAIDIQVQLEQADGSWKVVATYSYSGAQTNLVLQIEQPYYNGFGARVMVRQTAGTARNLPYIVINT